ncbi:uncharacterized protein LOC123306313 [Coccinella septempunctata]|uniref:uncharacterized protein LOC123306313 n=1 Tax=Coccinella septempunctata TaxID=41139 RepID=UPI001D06E69E|nr:uncharacterized protein LOC123306313 [Coccinella septempunctata]
MDDVDDKVRLFSETLVNLFDKHFPPRIVRISKRHAPWMTDENMSMNASSKEQWRELKSLGILNESRSDVDSTFKDPDEINDYFLDIPTNNSDQSIIDYYGDNPISSELFSFRLVDENDIIKVLKKVKNSAPGSDNISISFVKICCPHILPFLVNIYNSIILSSKFPSSWKCARVTPIPKKGIPKELSDLRPISILPGLSKILEKIMAVQLSEYLELNGILPATQSGFRPGYSATSALLDVTDDIFQSIDESRCSVLFLLDFSRAFDTVRHDILLAILKSCGVSGEALNLLSSYLAGRSQFVKLGDRTSCAKSVQSGVPQGSVLGPLLFIVYTSQFTKSILHGKVHMYADDFQILFDFLMNNFDTAAVRMNEDLDRLALIAEKHSLILNARKSFSIIFGSKNNKNFVENNFRPVIRGDTINFQENVSCVKMASDEELSDSQLESQDTDECKFIAERVKQYSEILEKSQLPAKKAKKQAAIERVVSEYRQLYGKDMTSKALMKKMGNMKTRLKKKTDKNKTGGLDVGAPMQFVRDVTAQIPPKPAIKIVKRKAEPSEDGTMAHETEETRKLSNSQLQRLVLLEQLKVARLQQEYISAKLNNQALSASSVFHENGKTFTMLK